MPLFEHIVDTLDGIVWGAPLLILFLCVGLYLTVRTRGIQFRYLYHAHKLAFVRHDDFAPGDISHFQALMTALAGTIGIGSIAGVATAITLGGMGAIFWMWFSALFGMAIKYGEAIVAIKYRVTDEEGKMCGGPMYYIHHGLKWRWAAILFAIFGIFASFGIGNTVQSNSVALALADLFHINPLWSGIILMIIVGVSLIGGIKSIGRVVEILVPAMALFYMIGGMSVIIMRITSIPQAFALIFKSAFNGQSAVGGFVGASVMQAVQLGFSRGVFSSEAGMGSSPIAAAAAKTDTPGRQALISMCSVFITTGIVCTITGLVIALSGVFGEMGADGKLIDGSSLALHAFDKILPYGGMIVTIALIPFAYSTILAWAYYGEQCVEYLFGYRATKYYRITFTLITLPGAILGIHFIWNFANMMNGLMAFPNLIALLFLSNVVTEETLAFECILESEKRKNT